MKPPVKPKVLVTRKVFPEALAILERHCDLETNQGDRPFPPPALIKKLRGKAGVVCLLTDAMNEKVMAACPDLKIISNVAVGYNNIDVKAATARRIMVTNTPGVLDDTTADFTWCLLLATARRVVEADKYFRTKRWKGWGLHQYLGHDLHHKALGVCGLGRIGKGVARRAAGFGMRVLYTDVVRADDAVERDLGATYVDKKTLFREADFVTLHVPLFPETTHYVSTAELNLMKRTAILINASRGPVVDEKALVKALKAGQIAGAGLDVYEKEPKAEPALYGMKNVVIVPHIASASVETRTRMATMAAENCVAGLAGRRPPNLLNPEVLS